MDEQPGTHECDRPAENPSPWRCPACGQVWEPLPAEGVKPTENVDQGPSTGTTDRVVLTLVFAGAITVGGMSAWAPELLLSAGGIAAMAGLVLAAVVAAFWQNRLRRGQRSDLYEEPEWRRRAGESDGN
ncbi:hypothetical protein ACIBKY_22795 [Nonomuraea sp. NPDC050394]|uniref:hypothetical protein n=1 Tax=Nonomuraea sp. NPDC050394 TaxID=3364363 RepID=UPI00379D2CFF